MKRAAAILISTLLYAFSAHADCAGVTSIERSSETIGPSEQVRTLSVTAPEGCEWDAAPTERWVTILSKPASGSGTLTYRITANPFTTVRGAQIFIEQFPLAITQNAAATPKPFRGDINGDGLADAFFRFGDGNKAYAVWWGSPTQGPWNRTQAELHGDYGHVAAMGSFQGDGHAGYALYDPKTLQVSMVFVGEGGQMQRVPVRTVTSTKWELVGAGDFDGDFKSDLLFRNVADGLLSIWFINGATLREAPVVNTRIVNTAWQVAGIADFDRDGKADILLRHATNGALSIWKMNGAAVHSTPEVAGAKPLPWRVVDVGDFNGDGDFDVLYRHPVTGVMEYHLMDGFAVTAVVPDNSMPPAQRITSIADVNGDGSDDVVFERLVDNSLTRTYRMFATAGGVDLSSGPLGLFQSRHRRAAAPSDFNGDGRSDLLLRHATYDYAATWEMNGTTILDDSIFAAVASPSWLFQQVAPFGGDLMSDIQLANNAGGGNTLAMWELAGKRILNSDEVSLAGGREVRGAGDFDGDGNADLLLQWTESKQFEVWLMAGHTVRSRTNIGGPLAADQTFDGIGDFDNDGLADIVLRNAGGAYIAWFMAGDTVRERVILGALSAQWKTLAMMDFDGDGDAEIVQRSPNTDEVALAFYQQGNMYGYVIGGAGTTGKYQQAGDYDGDGLPELIIRDSSSGAVTMWFIRGIYVYARPTFAHVVSPLWQFAGAYEPTPTTAPYGATTVKSNAVAGPSVAPFYGDRRTAERVQVEQEP